MRGVKGGRSYEKGEGWIITQEKLTTKCKLSDMFSFT